MLDFDDEFRKYLKEFAARAPNGSLLKGIPGRDKHNEEAEAARIVLQHLGKSGTIICEPCGQDTAPDIAIEFTDGTSIGLEVTEFVDQCTREWNIKRRHAQKIAGHDELSAFDAEQREFDFARNAAENAQNCGASNDSMKCAFEAKYTARHPTPGYIGGPRYRIWNAAEIASNIDTILSKKNRLLSNNRIKFSQIFIVIFNSEFYISEDHINSGKILTRNYENIDRAFFVFDYQPGNGYPVIELTAAK
jgi:hypothetical protein